MAQSMVDQRLLQIPGLSDQIKVEDDVFARPGPSGDDVQTKLESLEGHVTVIRSHLEKKPRKMTLAMLNNKLDRIIEILQVNGFNMGL